MKKQIILLALFSVVIVCFNACSKVVGSGPNVTETRNITGFDAISLKIDATVNYKQDSMYSVQVEAQDNIMDKIKTELSGSTLCIKHPNNTYIKSNPITITISSPELYSLDVSGSGEINTQNNIQSNNFSAEISGSGKIIMVGLNATTIDADISGSGKIQINSGEVNSVKTEISGSGDLFFENLLSQTISTQTTGSGTTKVYAKQILNVDISGSGDVYYKGTPTINAKISGSGKVQHIN